MTVPTLKPLFKLLPIRSLSNLAQTSQGFRRSVNDYVNTELLAKLFCPPSSSPIRTLEHQRLAVMADNPTGESKRVFKAYSIVHSPSYFVTF